MTNPDPAVPLVKTKGGELGARTEWIPGLQSSLALWQLQLDSEQVFIGDAGETEASGASTRRGIEFNNHYVANAWLTMDLDLAWSHARFNEDQGDAPNVGRYIPGAVNRVGSFGVSANNLGPWFGQFQVRYFGPRPLIEDNSVRSSSTTLAYARVGYKIGGRAQLMLDVFNLFDREVSDIDYYYESRTRPTVQGGAANTEIHSHPAEPRTFRLTLNVGF
jgi:outer membrane receptor protein involved in Fe transport